MRTLDIYRIESLYKAKQLLVSVCSFNVLAIGFTVYLLNFSLSKWVLLVFALLCCVNAVVIGMTVRRWRTDEVLQ
jgi:hypothetical protein